MLLGMLKFGVVFLAVVTTFSVGQDTKEISPKDEANYIALDASEKDLLPNAGLIAKIQKMVAKIRSEDPSVSKIRNGGRWHLGRLLITNFSPELKKKIDSSEFGPLKEAKVIKGKEAEVTFNKPYHPDRLSERLKKLGAKSEAIWFDNEDVPDLGRIEYDPQTSTYTFKEGIDTCQPDCPKNRWLGGWEFKVDEKTGNFTLDSTFATDLPVQRE